MSTPALKLRIGDGLYQCPFSTEAAKPRLCLRHDGTTYYAPLLATASKPRLAVNVKGTTKYAALTKIPQPVVYLPFTESATRDVCGNTWTAVGTPTIKDDAAAAYGKSASFDGTSWLLLSNITLGGQDFTVDFYMNLSNNTKTDGQILFIDTPADKYDMVRLRRSGTSSTSYFVTNTTAGCTSACSEDTKEASTITTVTTRVHIELVYRYAEKEMTLYVDGKPAAQRNALPQYTRQAFRIGLFGSSNAELICTGTVERFRVYDGYAARTEDYIAPNPDDFYKGCAVWLPFKSSVTADEQGNTWTTVGNPVIQDDENAISGKSLNLDGSSGLLLDEIELGGQDFTIDGWLNMSSETPTWSRVFRLNNTTATGYSIVTLSRDRNGTAKLEIWANGSPDCGADWGNSARTSEELAAQRIHFAVVYQHSAGTVTLYVNGTQAAQSTDRPKYNRSTFRLEVGYQSNNAARFLKGTLEHFRIFDGVAKWTEAFTPPTAEDYLTDGGLVSWLPFNNSFTQDLCGNTWTLNTAAPTIKTYGSALSGKAASFGGGGGLLLDGITLGGKNFTIDGWVNMSSSTVAHGRVFFLQNTATGYSLVSLSRDRDDTNKLEMWASGYADCSVGTGKTLLTSAEWTDQRLHFAVVYQYSAKKITLYINGKQVAQDTARPQYKSSTFKLSIGSNIAGSDQFLKGTLEHFRVFNGTAKWTASFTPPTSYSTTESNLVVYLPFTSSATKDECGNTWKVFDGTPTLTTTNAVYGTAFTSNKAVNVTLSTPIDLGGQDFTIDYWATGAPSVLVWLNGQNYSGGAGRLIYLEPNWSGGETQYVTFYSGGGGGRSVNIKLTSPTHIAFVYQHSSSTMKLYVGGSLVTSTSVTIPRNAFTSMVDAKSGQYVDEFRIFDGVAKWTANFTPPTADDYK